MRDAPENLRFDPVIGVSQPVAEICHFLPSDIRLFRLSLGWNLSGSLADNLQQPLNGEPQKKIVGKLLIFETGERTFNVSDRFEDAPHSIGEGRRHT